LSLQGVPDLRRLAVLGARPNSGLIVLPNFFADAHRNEIVALAAQYRLPAVYNDVDFVSAGGLLSYDTDLTDVFRQAASYVDRILRGAKPGDLPIQKPTRWALSVNLRTAQALGLTVPQSILLQAAEVVR
jgi:putative ABC transport system substrate-binding protein